MRRKQFLTAILAALLPLAGYGQSTAPTATYVNEDNISVSDETDIKGQAPLEVVFKANPKDMEGHTPSYEWHFRKEGAEQDMMVRYEEDTQFRFMESGKFNITLNIRLTDCDIELPSATFSVTISESKLEFPNAFSPNDDNVNDIYRAKRSTDGKPLYQSIVEFHAYIFNRWGQKLFEWTDPADGWDGKYKGRDCKEGVYYVLVKAKGADGREYNIKKDVNLLRGYTTSETSTTK